MFTQDYDMQNMNTEVSSSVLKLPQYSQTHYNLIIEISVRIHMTLL